MSDRVSNKMSVRLADAVPKGRYVVLWFWISGLLLLCGWLGYWLWFTIWRLFSLLQEGQAAMYHYIPLVLLAALFAAFATGVFLSLGILAREKKLRGAELSLSPEEIVLAPKSGAQRVIARSSIRRVSVAGQGVSVIYEGRRRLFIHDSFLGADERSRVRDYLATVYSEFIGYRADARR